MKMATSRNSCIEERLCTETNISGIEEELRNAGNNLLKLGKILGRYYISSPNGDVNSSEEARDLIENYITSQKNLIDHNKDQLESKTRRLLEFLGKEREHLLSCEKFYEEVESELNSQNMFVKCSLKLQCPGYEHALSNHSLGLRDCTMKILIIGEICAGKSSVLNLLMGGSYMASKHGVCTSIPCEVQHSRDRKAILHYEDSNLSPRIIDVSDDEEDEIWSKLQSCMETGEDNMLANEQMPKLKLTKIRIQWKLKFLEDNAVAVEDNDLYGVTFIDVPGIHDTDDTFINLHEEIKNADAFLFVINTSQHAGVDKDRLLRLMSDVQQIIEVKYGMFSSKCGLFVCNKWDLVVGDGVRERLQEEVFQKLRACWPRLTKKQIVPLTCSLRAVRNASRGIYDDEYAKFYKRLTKFVETSARLKTELSTWWLSTVVDRTVAIIRNMNNSMSFEQKKVDEIKTYLKTDVGRISETKIHIIMQETSMKKYIDEQVDILEKSLANILEDKRDALLHWDIDCIPKTITNVDKMIRRRILHDLNSDSRVESLLNKINVYVDEKMSEVLKLHVDLENSLTFSQGTMPDMPDMETSSIGWLEWIGTAIFIHFPMKFKEIYQRFSASIEEPTSIEVQNEIVDDYFQENRLKYMRTKTAITIKRMISSELKHIAIAILEATAKKTTYTFEYILNDLKVRNQMTKYLSDKIKKGQTPSQSAISLEEKSQMLQHFLIKNILFQDINKKYLRSSNCSEQEKECIGSGSFGVVYRDSYSKDTEVTPVAVKVIRIPMQFGDEDGFEYVENNLLFRECAMLRMLSVKPAAQRVNVVEYLGYFFEATAIDQQLFLVFELCDFSLDSLIQKEMLVIPGTPSVEVPFPGKVNDENTKGMIFVLDLAGQAAAGLKFLHDNNVVHTTKLSDALNSHSRVLVQTIKVSENNTVVKVCDFGQSRHGDLVKTVRTVGTVLYNAPEILAGRPHTFASDVYSLGLVIWELWYGETVYQNLKDEEVMNPNRRRPKMNAVPKAVKSRGLLYEMFRPQSEKRPIIKKVISSLREIRNSYRTGDYRRKMKHKTFSCL